MIRVPKEYTYIGVFLTLRCNFQCGYCINEGSDKLKRSRQELSKDQWINILNNLEINDDVPITIGGGEPTVHKGFYKIIDGINHPIDLLTNLEFDIIKFIHNVDPRKMFKQDNEAYKSIRASFHPEFMDIKETVAKAVILQNAGFHVGILPINHPNNTEANLQLCEEARKNKIYTFIKDYLGEYKGNIIGHFKYPEGLDGRPHVDVECRTQELLISPNANVFRCHRDLYADDTPIYNLMTTPNIVYKFKECDKFGRCNPCDLKMKVNRFLQMGSCSVEIKEKKINQEGFDA